MPNHGNTERNLMRLFSEAKRFYYNGKNYEILNIGKPRPLRGECKTDIYILCIDNHGDSEEFKISIKQSDADFLENKISYERAVEIFGDDTDTVLKQSILRIKESFENEPLVNISKYKRTEPKCIKIGWKFELLNKSGGDKSAEIILNDNQKVDVYSGTNLNASKRHSRVNGEIVENCGVANYILEVDDDSNDLNYYLNKLDRIEEFAAQQQIYFACKALNFRVTANKWDGDRPLAVFCEWSLNEENKLDVKLIFDRPLQVKGNEIGDNIRRILKEIEVDSNNFSSIIPMLSNTVKIHE